MMTARTHTVRSRTSIDARTAPAALAALLLGAFLVFGAGLAQPQALHEAAHDARHAFGFPCH